MIEWFHRHPFHFRAIAAFLAGAVMAFSMPPAGIWPLMFLCFSFFYMLLAGQGGLRSYTLGWLFGFGYFLIGLYWIGNALLVPGNPFKWVWPLTIAGLPVLLAVFTGLSCWAATRIAKLQSWTGYIAFISFVMLGEWLRGHVFTGFPWNLYGYTWSRHLPMIQPVSVMGTYGLSFLTLAWAALPGFLFVARPGRHMISLAVLALITTLNLCWIWGTHRLGATVKVHDRIIIRVVQPNIPQEDKWSGDMVGENLQKIILHSSAPKVPGSATITIWPETAISDYIAENKNAAFAIRQGVFGNHPDDLLVSGVLRHAQDENGQPLYFNSLFTYSADMIPLAAYDKSHLVPFGEYIPLNNIIPMKPFVDFSGFTPGPGLVTQTIAGIPPFSGLVCYEVIFPGAVTSPQNDSEWIINVTNDAWYGDSAGPYQHLTKAIFRAIEEGQPLARSANTGISAMIDPYGRVLGRIPYGTASFIDHPLPKPVEPKTLYARYDDTPVLAVLILLIACVFFLRSKGDDLTF